MPIKWRTCNGSIWFDGWLYKVASATTGFIRTKSNLLLYEDTLDWYDPTETGAQWLKVMYSV